MCRGNHSGDLSGGRRLFGRGAALVACLLLAVHPFHLELSQQARSYPLVVLLVSLSSWYFLRMVDDASWTNCIPYAVVSAASIYSHFFAGLVILANWLSLLLGRRPQPWKKLVRSLAILIALLIPAILYLLHSQRSHVAWIPGPSWRQALEVLYSLTLSKGRCLALSDTVGDRFMVCSAKSHASKLGLTGSSQHGCWFHWRSPEP